jgi:hypothetical protein
LGVLAGVLYWAAALALVWFLGHGRAGAEVLVSCYVEPNPQLKQAHQLGCDFRNQASQAVILSAADVRNASIEFVGSPLRYSVADAVVARSEKRGFWGTLFQMAKWVGVAASFAQGLKFIRFDEGDNWQYLIPSVAGGIQAMDSIGRSEHEPLRMAPDYLPEGDFVLDAFERRSYVLLAAKQSGLRSFRMVLGGRALGPADFAAPAGPVEREPFYFLPALELDAPAPEEIECNADFSVCSGTLNVDDRDLDIEDFAVFPTNQRETGGSSWFAVPQVVPVRDEGYFQAEPVKGVAVLTRGGAAVRFSSRFGQPLPLCSRELVYVGRDSGAVDYWVRIAHVTARNRCFLLGECEFDGF